MDELETEAHYGIFDNAGYYEATAKDELGAVHACCTGYPAIATNITNVETVCAASAVGASVSLL